MDNIKQMDAILAFDADGQPMEPEWPEADVIVGNPPFLGDKKIAQRTWLYLRRGIARSLRESHPRTE